MQGFALFRLPYEQQCTWLSGQVQQVSPCAALTDRQGFVFAPFSPSDGHPVLVIRPDYLEVSGEWLEGREMPVGVDYSLTSHLLPLTSNNYHLDFANFHARLLSGEFQKLVLSRCIDVERTDDASPLSLFRKACQYYPRMFISLVSTPQSGTWLAATPEVLLSGSGNAWHTMALAGTMPFTDDVRWSDKNIQEQRYVATYIAEQLEQFTSDFTEEGPRTVRAGHLAHLRSDFRFSLYNNKVLGDLIAALHPTPAVCGLPKQEALRFILQNEQHDRAYYSGFMGPLSVEGQTHLFVTLRCMQLFRTAYRLYAGGGLLRDSVEEQEWQETEAKLDTMRRLIPASPSKSQ